MKKLSFRHKKYLERRRQRVERKKNNSKKSLYKETHKRNVILTPENMNLDRAYKETVLFFNKVRKACDSGEIFEVDFTKLRHITPSAALILTSEMDRICSIRKEKKNYGKKSKKKKKYGLKVLDFNRWDEKIKILLEDMGMNKLLKIPNWKKVKNRVETDEIFLPFQRGQKASGDDARVLRDSLNDLSKIVPKPRNLLRGLGEAMDNSLFHAYPDNFQKLNKLKEKLWWMSASFNEKKKLLTIMFFDQGISIPASIKKKFAERVSSFFAKCTDGEIIKAATEIGRSGTGEEHRGNGLGRDIKEYVSSLEHGYLRIISRRGEYFYSNYSKKDDNTEEKVYNRNEVLGGTLIEWQAYIK